MCFCVCVQGFGLTESPPTYKGVSLSFLWFHTKNKSEKNASFSPRLLFLLFSLISLSPFPVVVLQSIIHLLLDHPPMFFHSHFPYNSFASSALPLPYILPPLCISQSLSVSSVLPNISLRFSLPLADVIATAV